MTKALMDIVKQFEAKCGKDWLKEVSDLNSMDALKRKAEEWDIELSDELLQEAFGLLTEKGVDEMSEEQLTAIAGGAKGIII
ncbi:MAG TPA: hypothetical protein P5107_09790 [Thermotogota bacterium]|nr:hypothetical protein [Thermotogota bacterium]HRW35332.1 hypothetical protein [Thermotogota bacterium]